MHEFEELFDEEYDIWQEERQKQEDYFDNHADDMYEHGKDGSVKTKANGDPKAKTSHSLNPVPCIIYDPEYKGEYSKTLNEGLGISSIAATCMNFLGFDAPSDYDKSVINLG